ncbi:MAG: BNR-4 repeat-containing protein, partial [Sedimentisphaerales bacterium]|nr:BNR-4 repeat-containing protein [Sedimentisphaerales bacterium]
MKRFITILSVLCFCAPVVSAFPSVTKIGDTVVEPQALSFSGNRINGISFQQEAVLTQNGWQYVTYYNAARHVCVSRRQLPSGSWEGLELPDYTMLGEDAHDVISMGVCPNDGTIH